MNRPLKLSEFVIAERDGIYVHPDAPTIDYSDGKATETAILQALSSTEDLGLWSTALRKAIADWPSEYHFSTARQNLLRNLPPAAGDHVLELGAGCGAITRQLGERCKKVVAIEGSLDRARAARRRCADLENVDVYCSDFQRVELEPRFDAVTLIGVLEYSPTFFESQEPFQDCLAIATSALKPDGKLVLAIENQLGLKYFAGCAEDHLAQQFVGLEDRYPDRTVRTFGRNDLQQLLKKAGLVHTEIFYPFPDYKLPEVILTERGLACENFLPEELLVDLDSRDYGMRFRKILDDRLIWRALARNGLIASMSNSFVVVASRQAPVESTKLAEALAIAYSSNRAIPFNCQTTFHEAADKTISTEKKTVHGDQIAPDSLCVTHIAGTNPYHRGAVLGGELERHIAADDYEGWKRLVRRWLEFLQVEGALTPNAEDPAASIMQPGFIDCIPGNIVLSENGLVYIDREWEYKNPFDLGVLSLRYLNRYVSEPRRLEFCRRHLPGRGPVLSSLYSELGLTLGRSRFERYVELANNFNGAIRPWTPPLAADLWSRVDRIRVTGPHPLRRFLKRATSVGLRLILGPERRQILHRIAERLRNTVAH